MNSDSMPTMTATAASNGLPDRGRRRGPVLPALVIGLAAAAACASPKPSTAPPAGITSAWPRPAATATPAPTLDVATLGPIRGAWRFEPLPVPAGLVPGLDEACRENLQGDLPIDATITLIDARGKGVLGVYYETPTVFASCRAMEVNARGQVAPGPGHMESGASRHDLGPQELEFTDFTWNFDRRPIDASYLVGRAGSAIARVEIRSPAGRTIVPSLGNGWWAVWVPGPMPVTWGIVGLDGLGRVVDTIEGVSQNQDP